ncbi:uncharacterized protein K452DRAFT_289651 [Aplosporella prunicola CBS 121167]|uniref:PHD-type domain-containing protein n=1 Tax=Aplosporella prunicola CBS 121167 TaxID=1176127 RepID=A0A6A6B6Z3_9PEZI|nr:uncharacterized protein K452DRAFT_289651 [Aplosporella prunicola CBS 121167]KAF2139656.1 hypothetical protein K452DRAFT_289651 [Aplosporella prunicola CBS 121167]
MSFKLSDLLNPASSSVPTSPQAQPAQTQAISPPDSNSAPENTDRKDSTGAYAATTLGSFVFGHGSPFSPHDQYASSAPYPQVRRTSSYGSVGGPVEPPSVDHAPHQWSPSLEQYHHGSKSPEEQRRQSLFSMCSNPNVLPPIQSFDVVGDRRLSGEQSQAQHVSPAPYGHDASHILGTSPSDSPRRTSQLSPNTIAQNREPDYVRDEPTTSQIRAPSPQAPIVDTTSTSLLASPPPQIKLEPSAPSREATPAHAASQTEQGSVLDRETLKAVADLKNEHGLRAAAREVSSSTAAAAPAAPMDATVTSPSAAKKRKPVNSVVKRGGGKKAPGKKRKTDGGDAAGGSAGRPSPSPSVASRTPASRTKKSQSGTPVLGSSPAPHAASSPAAHTMEDDDDDVESGSDDGIYCICRKGDNHTWMIACDGSCQDWYHGTCVNVDEIDGDLIEKYYCPKCTEAGEGHTTWKRMCRREGCRKPARRDNQSKYCSEECGVKFFTEMVGNLRGGSQSTKTGGRNRRDRRRTNQTDPNYNEGEDEEDDVAAGPRGGVVSARELKGLTIAARDVDHYKGLGNSMLSPPATASPTQTRFPHRNSTSSVDESEVPLPAPDAQRVSDIQAETAALKARLGLLKDRGRFVEMTRDQATKFAEKEGVKPKDICGYDARLAWSEGEFQLWRSSPQGQAALKQDSLEPTLNGSNNNGSSEADLDGDVKMDEAEEEEVDMVRNGSPDEDTTPTADSPTDLLRALLAPPDLCPKKRCQRHAQWLKISSYDVQFEVAQTRQRMGELEAEEREIRERALVRWRKERAEKAKLERESGEGGESGGANTEDLEGWVEVLG